MIKTQKRNLLLVGVFLSISCAQGNTPVHTADSTQSPQALPETLKQATGLKANPAPAKHKKKLRPQRVAKGFTLLDAYEKALNTNPAILQSISNQQAAYQNLKGTKAGYYPTVAASYNMGHNRSSVPSANYIDSFVQGRSITATQLLFDGGALGGLVGVADAQFEESEELTQSEVNTLANDTAAAYLACLRDKQLLALSKENLNSHYENLKGIKKRFHSGVERVSEYQLAESRLAQAQTAFYSSQNSLAVSESAYNRLVGEDPEDLVKPSFDTSVLPKSLPEALALAKKKNPAIKVAEKQLEAAKKSLAEAKASAYSPTVNLELSASRDRNVGGLEGVSVDMQGLVTVSYNLFDGGADMDAIRKAEALKIASQENLAEVTRTIVDQLTQAWATMLAAKKSVAAYRKRVASGKVVFASYRKQFMIGQRSLLNVLDVENQLFSSQTSMLSNEYNLQIEYYQILSDIGELPQYFAKEFHKKYLNRTKTP